MAEEGLPQLGYASRQDTASVSTRLCRMYTSRRCARGRLLLAALLLVIALILALLGGDPTPAARMLCYLAIVCWAILDALLVAICRRDDGVRVIARSLVVPAMLLAFGHVLVLGVYPYVYRVKERQAVESMQQLVGMIESFRSAHGTYPETLEQLQGGDFRGPLESPWSSCKIGYSAWNRADPGFRLSLVTPGWRIIQYDSRESKRSVWIEAW